MKPSSPVRAKSAKTLEQALSQVDCSAGLKAAIRAGDVAIIDASAPEARPATKPAGASSPKPR